MAFITADVDFNPDKYDTPIVGIAADLGDHNSGWHQHQKHQLIYATSGCINLSFDDLQCVLPPTKAAWIPANLSHCAVMRNIVAYRSIYFDPQAIMNLPSELKVININPLLTELINRMGYWQWDKPVIEQYHTLGLFLEELKLAPEQPLLLPIPKDKRLKTWLAAMQKQECFPQPLSVMASDIGASSKTISRIFIQETGMPYQAWRQQFRLQKAIEYLSLGEPINQIAAKLHFCSDSAFISFFKLHTNTTPRKYVK